MTGCWAGVPADRVVHLRGAGESAVDLALRVQPADGPAIVTYLPEHPSSVPETVTALLDQLDTLALRLWSGPVGAGSVSTGPAGAGSVSSGPAAEPGAGHFGPFLADLAERAGTGSRRGQPFTAEVRAAGLVRVIARSCHRERLAIVVYPPAEPTADAVEVLVCAAEWFVRHGHAGVWLAGACWAAADRVTRVTVELPAEVVEVAAAAARTVRPVPPVAAVPAIRGRPRADSPTECALEAALARQPWAHGRAWNETYQRNPLSQPILVDLIWPAERCVVELDGPEHRGAVQFEADRRRDVRLQLDGFAVLRFTNAQIRYELTLVLSQLERFINYRRAVGAERLTNV